MTVDAPTARPHSAREPEPSNNGRGTSSHVPATRAASAVRPSTARRLSPRARKAIVAAHTLVGVGWFGIVLAKIVIEIVGLTSRDQDAERVGYLFMLALDRAIFPPLAIATLVTGVVLSVATAWGLLRHWWIVVKLVLTVAVVATGIAFVGAWTEAAAVDGAGGSASGWLLGMGTAHALMLGAATVISVFKPWGQIRPLTRPPAGAALGTPGR